MHILPSAHRVVRPRHLVPVVIAVAIVLGGARPAAAKEFFLPYARVDVQVQDDGSLRVTESLTYDFSGPFSGGYREIPLRDGESIDDISVSEDRGFGPTMVYTPGASAELGSSGPEGSFGVADLGDRIRIVWHYSALDERRTFDVSYTFHGLAVAYDDVVDVNLQVWGDEWDVELTRLEAGLTLPTRAPGEILVWGHPASVDGFTEVDPKGKGASLGATGIPAHHWVEMRVVFPRSVLTGSLDAKMESGNGLQAILNEERDFARDAARDRERIEWLKSNAAWLVPLTLLLAPAPAVGLGTWVYRRYGREPDVPPAPEHVMEPPGDEAPALIAALMEPGHNRATGDAFTATLFDLVRRGHLDAMPTTTQRKTWAGLKTEDVSDLVVTPKERPNDPLTPWEEEVMEAVRHAAENATAPPSAEFSSPSLYLTKFRGAIKADPGYYAKRFEGFKAGVMSAVADLGWWLGGGFKPVLTAALVAGAVTAGAIALAVMTYDPIALIPWSTIVWAVVAGIAAANEVALIAFLVARRGWERRSDQAAEAAARWGGFRRFLSDFAGMKEAVPGSVEIWEQFLCYGIAFGIADRVLAAAQLYAPEELLTTSSVYWISHSGSLGSGDTAFAISDISHAVAQASTPSSGGGGGGGGGGGAW